MSTACKPISPFPSTSSTFERSATISLPLNTARIRIADINNPLNWYTYLWDVPGPWSIFQATNYGWMITFLRNTHGPASPEVVPSLIPTEGSVPSTEAWSAIVELPESTGVNQYCVTVLEEFGWAKLQTAEWTVVIIKAPSP
ncbi:MAG: hypothetical protein WKF77_19820 [Planctomycetaceae bacterium]